MNEQTPAPKVSVIIPLYNAEKYIAQCLGSVLHQTFQDYEVIVVDDCSTDRSVEIVEEIIPKSEGRLHLIRREKNSGGAAIPRNVGMRFAHGKYIAFCDNDDMFTTSALENLYNIAEQTQADVLHAEKYLVRVNPSTEPVPKLAVGSMEAAPHVDKPEQITSDLGERINQYVRRRFYWHVWNKFFRRDFIVENELEFPADIKIADDVMFCFFSLCTAKTYVRIPNVFNFYRVRDDSLSRAESPEGDFLNVLRIIVDGTRILGEFMDGLKFFQAHPEFKHIALNFFIQHHINQTSGFCTSQPPYVTEALVRKQFADRSCENAELISQLFTLANLQRAQIIALNNRIAELQR